MRRVPVPVTRRLAHVLDEPGSIGLREELSQAQIISTLVEEAIGLREERLRTEERRTRYATWAADIEYQRAVAEDAKIALSDKAI